MLIEVAEFPVFSWDGSARLMGVDISSTRQRGMISDSMDFMKLRDLTIYLV